MKFVSAVKKGNELSIIMSIELTKNAAFIKKNDIIFQFDDGLSDSEKVNELFVYIGHYVQAREKYTVFDLVL